MRNLFYIILSLSFIFITACSPTGKGLDNERKMNRDADFGSILGEGLTFGGDKDEKNPTSGIAINSFLWRAALDTISFMPLNQVDPFGGVILSDWHSDAKSTKERYKLNIYILSQQLKSNGVRVSIFKQIHDINGQWVDADIKKATATQIENSILTRAREMRIDYKNQQED